MFLIHASFARLSLNRPSDFSSTASTHRVTAHITIGLCTRQPQLFASKYPTISHHSETHFLSHSSYHNTTPPLILAINCIDESQPRRHLFNQFITSIPRRAIHYRSLTDWSSFPHRTRKLALCLLLFLPRTGTHFSRHLPKHILTSIAAYRIPQSTRHVACHLQRHRPRPSQGRRQCQ